MNEDLQLRLNAMDQYLDGLRESIANNENDIADLQHNSEVFNNNINEVINTVNNLVELVNEMRNEDERRQQSVNDMIIRMDDMINRLGLFDYYNMEIASWGNTITERVNQMLPGNRYNVPRLRLDQAANDYYLDRQQLNNVNDMEEDDEQPIVRL